jgi:hypothetical protein
MSLGQRRESTNWVAIPYSQTEQLMTDLDNHLVDLALTIEKCSILD